MIPITYLVGDATHPQGDGVKIIAHICNDKGKWGAGFVLALSKHWREPEECYRHWLAKRLPGAVLLGAVQSVIVDDGSVVVANMIAQTIGWIKGQPPIRYDALRACLETVSQMAVKVAASVHMPRIGCGLAGGSWNQVEPIIADELCAHNVPVFVYDLPERK